MLFDGIGRLTCFKRFNPILSTNTTFLHSSPKTKKKSSLSQKWNVEKMLHTKGSLGHCDGEYLPNTDLFVSQQPPDGLWINSLSKSLPRAHTWLNLPMKCLQLHPKYTLKKFPYLVIKVFQIKNLIHSLKIVSPQRRAQTLLLSKFHPLSIRRR